MTPHNPKNLTDKQIGTDDGFRLLDRDESQEESTPSLRQIEGWSDDNRDWTSGMYGVDPSEAYRTKLSRAELRAARGLPPEESNPTEETSEIGSFSSLAAAFVDASEAMSVAAHKQARKSGFWDDSDRLQALADAHDLGAVCYKQRGAQLNALVAGEIGEALEGLRKNLPSDKLPGFTNEEEEYADAIIRIMDLSHARNLRIWQAVPEKMRVNATRAHKHGGKHF